GSGNQQGGPSPNAVAVQGEGGELTNAELGQAIDKRRVLDAFITEVSRQGRFLAQMVDQQNLPAPVRLLGLLRDSPDSDRGWSSAQVQTDTITNLILAQKARKLGMHISDEAVEEYLAVVGLNLLGADEMQAVLDTIANRQVSAEVIIESVREA